MTTRQPCGKFTLQTWDPAKWLFTSRTLWTENTWRRQKERVCLLFLICLYTHHHVFIPFGADALMSTCLLDVSMLSHVSVTQIPRSLHVAAELLHRNAQTDRRWQENCDRCGTSKKYSLNKHSYRRLRWKRPTGLYSKSFCTLSWYFCPSELSLHWVCLFDNIYWSQ